MKIMISQPMKGKTNEQIREQRAELVTRLQEEGLDTVEANVRLGFPADMREYSLSAQMLRYLGVKSVRLMTNNPLKTEALEHWGIRVMKRVPIIVKANKFNENYMVTKVNKMGHMITKEELEG